MSKLFSIVADDTGALSTTRVVVLLVTLAVIVPKVVVSIRSGVPVMWGVQDMGILGVVMGAKLVQNTQENKQPPTPPPASPP